MPKKLAELLNAREPLFSRALQQLETASGQTSADVRLIADIESKIRSKTRSLGLDPNDTTGRELYHALVSKVMQADHELATMLGSDDPEDAASLTPKIVKKVKSLDIPKIAWVVKKSVAKKLLQKMPPQTVMKKLGYKSIASMLKNENIFELYGALRFAESQDWMEAFLEHYSQLKPSDFETRKIEFYHMPAERWTALAKPLIKKKKHNVTHLKELGVIIILPTGKERFRGVCMTLMPLLLHYVNEIRLYSAFFKLEQVKPEFGAIIVETLIGDPSKAALMAGQHIHWRVIQRYFGKLDSEHHPEIFEPHVQPEDLHWRRAEDVMFKVDKELGWWKDLDYVGALYDGDPISFNLMDLAVSFRNDTSYEQRETYHFKEALWNEIFARYLGQRTLQRQVLRQLDNDVIAPETF